MLSGGCVKNRPPRQKLTVDGRLREKLIVDGRLRKKKGRIRGKEKRKKKKEGKKEYLARAPSSPACHCRPRVVARGRSRFFSRARRRSISPRGEKDRGDAVSA
ncbi:hypothetical protein BHE74_00038048, partial [Ensete ventricosum]